MFEKNVNVELLKIKKMFFHISFHKTESVKNFSINTRRLIDLSVKLGEIFELDNETVEQSALKFYYPYQKATSCSLAISPGGPLHDLYYRHTTKLYNKYLSS